jgi:hypothetical protein
MIKSKRIRLAGHEARMVKIIGRPKDMGIDEMILKWMPEK